METTTVWREDARIRAKTQESEATQQIEREIRALLDEGAAKGSVFDIEGVMAQFADDVVTYDCPPPLQSQGKEPIRQSWYRDVVNMFQAPVTYRHEDVHVKASKSGDLAVAYSLMRFNGNTKDGKPMKAMLRCTNVFEKRDGRWLIVHGHVSVPIDYDGKGLMELEP